MVASRHHRWNASSNWRSAFNLQQSLAAVLSLSFLLFLTDHDGGLARHARGPLLDVEMRAPPGVRNQARVG
ncbi:hypothetical protein XI06_30070 [Bradyrhizobium sp. CCBAU 11434]|nr:hypothetical protein [Bradyrhizobium sp. CCBAU 11434]